jgi:hypothetical protein
MPQVDSYKLLQNTRNAVAKVKAKDMKPIVCEAIVTEDILLCAIEINGMEIAAHEIQEKHCDNKKDLKSMGEMYEAQKWLITKTSAKVPHQRHRGAAA